MLYAIVGMLVIILDQVVKYWVDKNINPLEPIRQLIPGVVSLVRVQNDGAAFSFLAGGGARVWFIVLTGIFTLAVVLALATNFISGRFGRWCLVLVTAGGLSNCIDRILYGYVLDMFKVEFINFAVFNVADIFITVFAIAFILYILFGGEKEKEDPDEFDEEDSEDRDRPARSRKPRKEKFVRDEDDADALIAEAKQREASARAGRQSDSVPASRPAVNRRAQNNAANVSSESAAAADEFEAFFAPKKEVSPAPVKTQREKPVPAPVKPDVKPVYAAPKEETPKFDPSDPFAEWDRANGKSSYEPVQEPVAAVPREEPATTRKEEPRPLFENKKPAASSGFSDDFDLDSILDEFK